MMCTRKVGFKCLTALGNDWHTSMFPDRQPCATSGLHSVSSKESMSYISRYSSGHLRYQYPAYTSKSFHLALNGNCRLQCPASHTHHVVPSHLFAVAASQTSSLFQIELSHLHLDCSHADQYSFWEIMLHANCPMAPHIAAAGRGSGQTIGSVTICDWTDRAADSNDKAQTCKPLEKGSLEAEGKRLIPASCCGCRTVWSCPQGSEVPPKIKRFV